MSSRSSTSRARWRVCRSITSCSRAADGCRASSSTAVRIGASGLRSSCPSIARKSSLRRAASSTFAVSSVVPTRFAALRTSTRSGLGIERRAAAGEQAAPLGADRDLRLEAPELAAAPRTTSASAPSAVGGGRPRRSSASCASGTGAPRSEARSVGGEPGQREVDEVAARARSAARRARSRAPRRASGRRTSTAARCSAARSRMQRWSRPLPSPELARRRCGHRVSSARGAAGCRAASPRRACRTGSRAARRSSP